MAWQAEQDLLCSGCKHPRDITFSPDAFQRFDAEPLVCHRCAAKDRAAKKYQDAGGDPAGVYYATSDREEEVTNGR